jgi:hypothetical protein
MSSAVSLSLEARPLSSSRATDSTGTDEKNGLDKAMMVWINPSPNIYGSVASRQTADRISRKRIG